MMTPLTHEQRIGSAMGQRKFGSQYRLDWARGKIGHTFGPLLEQFFSDSFPKAIFNNIFWTLLEML